MGIYLRAPYRVLCKSPVVTAVPPGNGPSAPGRVLIDGCLVKGRCRAAVPRLVRHAQPADEYDEQLEQHERNEQQGECVRVPVNGVLVVRAREVNLSAGFALLRFEFEFVLDPDLLEHHFVRLVVGTPSAATSAKTIETRND